MTWALALANARYWIGVAPIVRRELACWREVAGAIGDERLRGLALGKLAQEGFNAEVAATLATLAPPATRARVTRAIVALEVLFDYLDGRTEMAGEDPLGEGKRLFGFFTGAFERQASESDAEGLPDGEYLQALAAATRAGLFALPSAEAVADVAHACAVRCAQTQTRLHAAATLGDGQLREWAQAQAGGSGLGWREFIAGSASSVLAMHALIAAAADPATSAETARRIDAAYQAIGGLPTILDSLADHSADAARGEAGFVRLYADREELEQRLCALTREALVRTRAAPHGAHHAMTLAGITAYYTSQPGAREAHARPVAAAVARELSPAIWPALAIMHAWRAAKRARALVGALLVVLTLGVCVSAVGAVAASYAGASAQVGGGPRARMSMAFQPKRLGGHTTVSFAVQIEPVDEPALAPISQLEVSYPSDFGLATSGLGLAPCDPVALELQGTRACPADSQMGTGSAVVEVPFGPGIVQEPVRLYIFAAPSNDGYLHLAALAEGLRPVLAQTVIAGVLLPGRLLLTVPPVASLPAASFVSVVSIRASLGGALTYYKHVHGRSVAYRPLGIQLPESCPAGGWRVGVSLMFIGGRSAQAGAVVGCPRR